MPLFAARHCIRCRGRWAEAARSDPSRYVSTIIQCILHHYFHCRYRRCRFPRFASPACRRINPCLSCSVRRIVVCIDDPPVSNDMHHRNPHIRSQEIAASGSSLEIATGNCFGRTISSSVTRRDVRVCSRPEQAGKLPAHSSHSDSSRSKTRFPANAKDRLGCGNVIQSILVFIHFGGRVVGLLLLVVFHADTISGLFITMRPERKPATTERSDPLFLKSFRFCPVLQPNEWVGERQWNALGVFDRQRVATGTPHGVGRCQTCGTYCTWTFHRPV